MANPKRSRTAGAFAIMILEGLFSIGAIEGLKKPYAIWTSAGLLAIAMSVFVVFLLAMVSDRGGRRPSIVALFVVVNLAAIISLFGNIYRWTGLKDTVRTIPSPHPLLDAIYFSTVTWTTLGYGDIVPLPEARAVAAIEALMGYIVMALLIAVLLAMVKSE
jgi:hypothetical protein